MTEDEVWDALFDSGGRPKRITGDLVTHVVCSHGGVGKRLFLAEFVRQAGVWIWISVRADAVDGDGPIDRRTGARRPATGDRVPKRQVVRERPRGQGSEVKFDCERCSKGRLVRSAHYTRDATNFDADLNHLIAQPLSYTDEGGVRVIELDMLVLTSRERGQRR